MSKSAIDRAHWAPDERAEYEDMLGEIVGETTDTRDRLNQFEVKLGDAIQAHRPWASEVERACLRSGMAKEISRYEDRNRALVSYDGRVLNVPAVQARKVVSITGEISYQRELIEVWPWDQIIAKRIEALTAQRTYDAKIAHYDRLLALRVMSPESTSPVDAAQRLGLDLDDFLAEKKAA